MSLTPPFDAIELLPAIAADRLRMLRQRALDAHAVIPPFDDLRDANMAKTNAQNRLTQLQAHPSQAGWNLSENDVRVTTQRKIVDALTAAAARIAALTEQRSTAWRSVTQVVQNVEGWLSDGGRPSGTALEVVETPAPTLQKGETLADAIGRLRQRGGEVRDALNKIESAPFPSAHAKQKMRAQIEALAQAGQPDVAMLVAHDREVEFKTRRVTSQVHNTTPGVIAYAEVPDTIALLTWMHRDALIAKLDAEISNAGNDRIALTPETRQLQSAKLQGDLLAVERDECELIWRAQSEGLPIEHRSDISPIVLLGLRLVTAPIVDGRGGSDVEHAYDVTGR